MAASILLLNLTTFLIAQDFSGDFDRMRHDLRIMEGILNKLLKSGSQRGIHPGGETKGVYLEDFGIVFQTQDHAPLMVIQNLAETYRTQASEEAIKKYEKEINAVHAEIVEEKEKVKQLEME